MPWPLHNYHDTHRKFPGIGQTSSRAFSVLAKMLPYAEQANLQDLIDFKRPIYGGAHGGARTIDPANEEAARKLVPMFRCPSDGAEDLFTEFDCDGANGQAYRGSNVMVCTGSARDSYWDLRSRTDGLFYYNSACGFRNMTDGTSNVVVFSETLLGNGVANGPAPARPHEAVAYIGHQSNVNPDVAALSAGAVFCLAWPSWLRLDSRQVVLDHLQYLRYAQSRPFRCVPTGLRLVCREKLHPGGVNVALGDGSVRFVTDTVDRTTWNNLGSIADGNVLGQY